ncbi:hypothetical protein DPMN_012931 [Dreissena polymorpha]|uniref:Uncharacterized protein n=1 Tax=Dreissena polymorpha TaxID=45954 RepID=A0A9D4N3D0_DREPO|nr:hypothetical protein DPMN_012931 [Dreissena polymorpha]
MKCNHSWQTAHRCLQSENRFEARLLTLAFPVPACCRLCIEDLYGSEALQNSVDTLKTVGQPRLFR